LPGSGYYSPPTVLDNVSPEAEIAHEEIFGPVAPVYRFETEEQAIRLANATEYGLAAYVYSGDLTHALRVGKGIESGMIAINRGLISDPAALLASGIYDLSGIPESFLKDEARMTPEEAEAWSPLSSRHSPGPRRIITRDQDETLPFHRQAPTLAELLEESGAGVDLCCEQGLNHLTVVQALGDQTSPLGRLLTALVASSREPARIGSSP
jgi:hypothetical protein